MNQSPVKLLAGFSSLAGLLLLLAVTFNTVQNPHWRNSLAETKEIIPSLITSADQFVGSRTVRIDFSKEDCCKVLSHEYISDGVIFDNENTLGWSSRQSDKHLTHMLTEEKLPGAPAGVTGTRIILAEPVYKVGFMIQSGTPYEENLFRPAKSITLKAYNQDNRLLFFEVTDTCLSKADSCRPEFIGVESNNRSIKFLEVIMNEPLEWSLSDLRYQI